MKAKGSSLFTLLILACIFVVLPFMSDKALAANFTQWCYGTENIVKVGVDGDNNVWAVGSSGKIAMFNGLEWKPKASSAPGSPYEAHKVAMDLSRGRIWIMYSPGSPMNSAAVSYWSQTTGWVYAGLFESDYGRHAVEIVVDRNGYPWILDSYNDIYKWDGVTGWIKVWDDDGGSAITLRGVKGLFYDANAHRLITGWYGGSSTWYSYVSVYNIQDNTRYRINRGKLGGDVRDVVVKDGKIYMMEYGFYYWNGSDWVFEGGFGGREYHKDATVANNTLFATGYYNTIDSTNSVFYTWPFAEAINDVAGGVHGELYAVGDGGRMAVMMGGSWYQDTSFFTDYNIGAIKDYSLEARDAALAANAAANTASTNALNAYNSVSNAYGNTISAVRDAGGTVLEEARQSKTNSLSAYNEAHTANTKLDSIQASITNIQNNLGADVTPPTVKIRTLSGALATSGSSIQAVLDISDNAGGEFTYSLDGVGYSPVPANRIIILGISAPGPNLIPVWVKDEAGNVGTASITIRKL